MFTYPTTSPYVFARSWSVRASPFKEQTMKHFVNMKKDLKSLQIANIWSTKYEFWMSLRLLSKQKCVFSSQNVWFSDNKYSLIYISCLLPTKLCQSVFLTYCMCHNVQFSVSHDVFVHLSLCHSVFMSSAIFKKGYVYHILNSSLIAHKIIKQSTLSNTKE